MAAGRNRLGYRFRKVVQAKPHKKIKETDALFDHSKKQMPKPWHLRASNAGVSRVKRR